MRYVNIVHLSDLHLTDRGVAAQNQIRILSGLERDLKELSKTHLKPDIIVFSGDLSNAGDKASLSACRTQLYRLLEACNLPADRLIPAPGNHDALQSVAERDSDKLLRAREDAVSLDGANTCISLPRRISSRQRESASSFKAALSTWVAVDGMVITSSRFYLAIQTFA